MRGAKTHRPLEDRGRVLAAHAAMLKQKAEPVIAQERMKAVNEVKDETLSKTWVKHHDRNCKDVRRSLYDLAAEEGLETRILGSLTRCNSF